MVPQRRVFQAKPGVTGAVVAKMNEFQPIFESQGGPPCRIYTDRLSGHTDRVVWAFQIENLTALKNLFWAASQDAEYQKTYGAWYQALTPLIEGATVELWNLEA